MQADGRTLICAYCLEDPPRPGVLDYAATIVGGDALCIRHAQEALRDRADRG